MAILERQGEVAMGAECSDLLYSRLKPSIEREASLVISQQ